MKKGRSLFFVLASLCATAVAPASAEGFDDISLGSGRKLSEFKVVRVAPVELALNTRGSYRRGGNSARPVDETSARHKAVDFQREMLEALVGRYGLSKSDGAGILTISATLTKLEPNGRTTEDYKSSPSLSPMSSGSVDGDGAAMRIVFSENGLVLGSISDDYSRNSRNSPGEKVWDEVDEAFELWAANLRTLVDQN